MITVNLLPPSVRATRKRRRRVRAWIMAMGLAGMIAVLPAAAYVARTAHAASLGDEIAPLRDRLSSVARETERLIKVNEQLSARLAQANALRSKRSWSGLLNGIAERLPDQVWLAEINTIQRQGTPSLASRRQPVPGTESGEPSVVRLAGPIGIRIQGYALDHEWLYELMTRLKSTEAFRRVELIEAGREPVWTGHAIRFSLECEW